MSRRSVTKGKVWEREVAAMLRQALPELSAHIRRGVQSLSRAMPVTVEPDVICPPFWLELKCGKLPNIRAALAQAQRDARDTGLIPIAVVRDDRKPAHVTLALSDFLALARAALRSGALIEAHERESNDEACTE